MKYSNIVQGTFLLRSNRFIAQVIIDGRVETCHVKNTGRLGELLKENATVFLQKSPNPDRKTAYSLIGVVKGSRIVNIDSQAPNRVFYESLLNGKILLPGFKEITQVMSEKTYGNSRFDFYVENKKRRAFIEVKGVTLEEDGVAKFPDAPTERGVKHVMELVKAKNNGFDAFVVFIIQMSGIKYFTPNDTTHREFGNALRYASQNGVRVLAYECDVGTGSMELSGKRNRVVLNGPKS